MLRKLSTGHIVWEKAKNRGSFSPELLQELKRWRQLKSTSKEAGGVLLGFIDADTGGLLAEYITQPGLGDKRTRTGFFRGPRHQKEAEEWYCATNSRGTQLGLWHTHPESKPRPSHTDQIDLHKVMTTATYDCNGLLYIIIGTQYAGCWFASRQGIVHEIGYFNL